MMFFGFAVLHGEYTQSIGRLQCELVIIDNFGFLGSHGATQKVCHSVINTGNVVRSKIELL